MRNMRYTGRPSLKWLFEQDEKDVNRSVQDESSPSTSNSGASAGAGQPNEKAKSSDLRQVVKPISDAMKGKTSLQTGLHQAVRGYFNPELMRAIEDGVRAANKVTKQDFPDYGTTALSGSNGKYRKK